MSGSSEPLGLNSFPAHSLELIAHHEGFSPIPYKDSRGFLTILYGHNLDATSLCPESQSQLDAGNPRLAGYIQLQRDAQTSLTELQNNLSWYSSLSSPRQAVLLDMCYNMGWQTFSTFHTFLSYCENEEWVLASQDGMDTKWATEVGDRAKEDMMILERGNSDGITLPSIQPDTSAPS